MRTIDFQNGKTSASAEIMETFQENIRSSVEEDVLYQNFETGTLDNVTLANNKLEYDFLDISYFSNYTGQSKKYMTKRVPVLNKNQDITLTDTYVGSVYIYNFNATLTITEESIIFNTNRTARQGANSYDLFNTPYLYICEVLGAKSQKAKTLSTEEKASLAIQLAKNAYGTDEGVTFNIVNISDNIYTISVNNSLTTQVIKYYNVDISTNNVTEF